MVDVSEIIRLCRQGENEYSAFLNELKKLEVQEYPTEACQDLIDELRCRANGYLKQIQKKAKMAAKSPGQLGKRELEIDDIKVARNKLEDEHLAVYLDWLNGAQTRKVPWSFIPSAEELAKKIIPDREVILYCENQYNYRIVWCENPKKGIEKYCFVSLPRLHRTNILMHVLIGHELFHPLCEKFTDRWKNEVAGRIAQACRTAYPEYKPDTLFGQKKLGAYNEILRVAWKRAVQEILCDIALGKIFGPAGLLAMRAFASFSEWKGKLGPETNFYPPPQYRFEKVWQMAIDKKALETLQTIVRKAQDSASMDKAGKSFCDSVNKFGKTLKSNDGFQHVMRDKLYKIAYAEVDSLLPEAAKFVDDKLPQGLPKWSDDNSLRQIPELVSRLRAGLPPNEIPNYTYNSKRKKGSYEPEAAAVPAILTAGWIYQCHREQAPEKKRGGMLDHDALSRLLLKACEDSEMLRSHT